GRSWQRLSGDATTGLPDAGVSELAADPGDDTIYYAAVPGVGIFRTTNSGTSWSSISNGLPANTITDGANIRLSVSPARTRPVYAAFYKTDTNLKEDGKLLGVFRFNAGTWSAIGTAPTLNAPSILFSSLLADNVDQNVVYVGGGGDAIFRGNATSGNWIPISS